MKVLIVTNMFPSGNDPYYGIFVSEQISSIKKFHPDVFFEVEFIDGTKSKLEYLKSIFKINKKIRTHHFDLVHIHFGISGVYLLSPFTPKIPTIVTLHGSDIQKASGNNGLIVAISKLVIKKATAAITLNDSMTDYVRYYNKNTYQIPCHVSTDIFKPLRNVNSDKPIINRPIQIIFPSNHSQKVKNYPLFCETIKILRDKYSINVVEHELKNMTRLQIAELNSKADLLLLTSKAEGSPQVVKEAMACNLPCVCTPVGDVNILLDGVMYSYVAKNNFDANELAKLVVASLNREKKGITGRERIFDLKLDENSVIAQIFSVYQKYVKTSEVM